MKITVEDMKATLREAGLENAGVGVIFPWGAKIVEFEGRKALQSATPEEYREAVRKETGRTLSDEELFPAPTCVFTTTGCISQGCDRIGGRCDGPHWDPPGYHYCICKY